MAELDASVKTVKDFSNLSFRRAMPIRRLFGAYSAPESHFDGAHQDEKNGRFLAGQ
jgi:hypothetical protein